MIWALVILGALYVIAHRQPSQTTPAAAAPSVAPPQGTQPAPTARELEQYQRMGLVPDSYLQQLYQQLEQMQGGGYGPVVLSTGGGASSGGAASSGGGSSSGSGTLGSPSQPATNSYKGGYFKGPTLLTY